MLLQLLGEKCNEQHEATFHAVIASCFQRFPWVLVGWAVPSSAWVYLPCGCCSCQVSSVLKSKRLPFMQLLQLLGEQCSQKQESTFHAAVATAWWAVPSLVRGYLSCPYQHLSTFNAAVATARWAVPSKSKRLPFMQLLQLSGEHCPHQHVSTFHAAVANAR